MMLAELHGKVPDGVSSSEDVLTSHVFGVLEALDPEDLLLPWLRKATRLDGSPLTIPPCDSAFFWFWPSLESEASTLRVEPDVFITLKGPPGVATLILVEAKFRSVPSGWPTGPEYKDVTGQLGQEWIVLSELPPSAAPRSPKSVGRRILLYVTADLGRPAEVMRQMADELDKAGVDPTCLRENLYWLGWRDLSLIIDRRAGENTLIQRLRELLEHRHLSVFGGCQPPPGTSAIPWAYRGRKAYSLDAPGIEALRARYESRRV